MLSSKKRYEFVTFRKRYPCLLSVIGFIIVLLPIIILLFLIFFCSPCPKQVLSDDNNNKLIPSWINKRSSNNLLNHKKNRNNSTFNIISSSTIFISIAAYRDPECRNTILQIFEKAAFPSRLRVGIFTQNNITDLDCIDFRDVLNCDQNIDYKYLYKNDNQNQKSKHNHWSQKYLSSSHVLCGKLWQIKIDRVTWKDSLGPTYGRYRSELFYNNEDYVLQMDSHTALAQDWDIILIKMHLRLNNDYGIITTYPRPLRYNTLWHYSPPQISSSSQMYVICATQILSDKVTKSFKLRPAKVIKNVGRPILTGFFAAGFSFQRGHRLLNVPYDPYAAYLFDGEEMSMAVRMWTSGYDFYAPNSDVAYHLYSPNDNKIRPVFWDTNWNIKWKIARNSEYRINYMLGLHKRFHANLPQNKYDLREIDKYGCGNKRNVNDFWNFTRINLDTYESENLCDIYAKGGMDEFRIPWIDKENDPYSKII